MGLDRFKVGNNGSTLTKEDVRDRVEEMLPVYTNELANNQGYTFYPENKNTETAFTTVTSGPRVFVDPTAKNSVFGSSPEVVIQNADYDDTVSWRSSYNYSRMLSGEDEIPKDVEEAITRSYEIVLETY
jgi:hypothetical protein